MDESELIFGLAIVFAAVVILFGFSSCMREKDRQDNYLACIQRKTVDDCKPLLEGTK